MNDKEMIATGALVAIGIAFVFFMAFLWDMWKVASPRRAIAAARAQTPQPPEFVLARNPFSELWRAERFSHWAYDEDTKRAVAVYNNFWAITPDADKKVIIDQLDELEAAEMELNAWKRLEAYPSGASLTAEDLF